MWIGSTDGGVTSVHDGAGGTFCSLTVLQLNGRSCGPFPAIAVTMTTRSLVATLSTILLTACADRVAAPRAAAPNSPTADVASSFLSWNIVDLGVQPLFGFGFFEHGIGGSGHVVGEGRINLITQGGMVTPDGQWVHLRPLPGDVLSNAFGVNASGLAIGLSSQDSHYNVYRPVIWTPDGTPEVIPGLGYGNQEIAEAINDAGVVVGEVTHNGRSGVGFAFIPKRGIVYLDPAAPGLIVNPTIVNERGQIAGACSLVPGQSVEVACLWDLNGHVTVLGAPFGLASSWPGGMNNSGVMVGVAGDLGGPFTGWRWSRANGFQSLPTPVGYVSTRPCAIDDRGRIYGFAYDAAGVAQQIIWEERTPTIVPPAPDGGMPDRCLVTRNGIMLGHVTLNGATHVTLWYPQ